MESYGVSTCFGQIEYVLRDAIPDGNSLARLHRLTALAPSRDIFVAEAFMEEERTPAPS
jgi:hypothetical protein